jgi:NAD+ diphosphatase
MIDKFIPSIGDEEAAGPGWYFVFTGYKLLVRMEAGSVQVPFLRDIDELELKTLSRLYLGSVDGNPCYAVKAQKTDTMRDRMAFRPLRSLYAELGDDFFRLAGLALQLLEWDGTNLYCGTCSGALKMRADMRAKECSQCGRLVFPRISPAVIVLVEREKRVLLARSGHFAQGLFSVIAGFVEPGETLEEAVYREVKEEVGIEVANIRYFGSQSWPFPDSLMIGFTAEYAAGEIAIDGKEIIEAGWFDVPGFPLIPDKVSISRHLIDWFLNKQANSKQPR